MNYFDEHSLENFLEKSIRFFTPDRILMGILFIMGSVGIILSHKGVFPLGLEYFAFYSFLFLLFSLYRPIMAFGVLVFFLPFEVFTVTEVLGTALRPYQWVTVVLLIAVLILLVQKKLIFPTIRWFDYLLLLLIIGTALAVFRTGVTAAGLQDIVVLLSFAGIYGLGRLFLLQKGGLVIATKSFLASSVLVAGYALYQQLAFEAGKNHFMVMPGRPNSTFVEADWLGFFIGLALIVTLTLLLQALHQKKHAITAVLFFAETLFIVTLITTVSRSAWLGILLALTFFFGFLFWREKKLFLILVTTWLTSFIVAISIVLIGGLTRFDLSQRFESTATTKQTITISCQDNRALPAAIDTVDQLAAYECRHIDLELIGAEKAAGRIIQTVERPDPNVAIRASIYQQSLEAIQKNWFFGIGPSASAVLFGIDGRGASLNSSNMFLESWLTAGILGFVGLTSFWFLTGGLLFRSLMRRKTLGERWYFLVTLLALWVHASVFNFFNAGLLLAQLFLLLSFFAWYLEKKAPLYKNIWR